MLDLQPGRSLVQNFLKEGIDLYMIDWGYPTRKDRYLTIDDHVNGYMDSIIDFIPGGTIMRLKSTSWESAWEEHSA